MPTDKTLLDLGVALIAFAAALLGSIVANLIAPSIEDRRQRKTIERQRKIVAIDSIHNWVREHLTSTTLAFFAASERTEDWRSAVLRYEESDAAFTHTLALAKRLKKRNSVEEKLNSLATETEKMLKEYAWSKKHLSEAEKDDKKLKDEFDRAKQTAINLASEIYTLLDDEAAELLGLKGLFNFRG